MAVGLAPPAVKYLSLGKLSSCAGGKLVTFDKVDRLGRSSVLNGIGEHWETYHLDDVVRCRYLGVW